MAGTVNRLEQRFEIFALCHDLAETLGSAQQHRIPCAAEENDALSRTECEQLTRYFDAAAVWQLEVENRHIEAVLERAYVTARLHGYDIVTCYPQGPR